MAPKKAGRKVRGTIRFNDYRSKEAMQAYRCGYNVMWKHAAEYMEKKKLPKPGTFEQTNHHGGKLWAMPNECKLTGLQAARIMEICYEAGVSEAQLRQVKKSLSYAHFLRTGTVSRNWKEVKNMWDTFMGNFGEVVRPTKPEHIPTPDQLKAAFTRPWVPEGGMSLMMWAVALLISWDWAVAGLRSKCDLNKVKLSKEHDVNGVEGYSSTGFVEGRSKLCGRKRGSRPWRVWRICLCPKGEHINVPDDVEINKAGNPLTEPAWTTNCPVACHQLVLKLQTVSPRCYPKWLKCGEFRKHNIGDPVGVANAWFDVQKVRREKPYSTNSGRKSLARWLSRVKATYEKGFEIHGDLFSVWSENYQPDCENPTGFNRRTQSTCPDHCMAAYKKLRRYFGIKVPSKKPLSREGRLLLMFMGKVGMGAEAQAIVEEDDV